MTDAEKQAAFINALRKQAEEAAAKDPVLAEMRMVGKALLSEARKRIAEGSKRTSIAAYLKDGTVSLVEPEATDVAQAGTELLSNLKRVAEQGNIQAAAQCEVVHMQSPDGSVEKFVSVHAEHSTGKATISKMPADEAVLMRGVSGASGPAIRVFGGPTNPKIFASRTSNTPILKIAILADGRITVDSSPATIESVRVSLKRLAEQKGVVWYYREGAQGSAPPQSDQVVRAVIENRLPIRLSSRADYSDAIGTDGRPIPSRPPTT